MGKSSCSRTSSKKELERIADSFKERTFNAGDVIAAEGKSGIGFFVIESGTAKATHGDLVIAELGPARPSARSR